MTRPYTRLMKNVVEEISISEDNHKSLEEIKAMTIEEILENHKSGLKTNTAFALEVCSKIKKQDYLINHLVVNFMCLPGTLFYPRTFAAIVFSYLAIVSTQNIKGLM